MTAFSPGSLVSARGREWVVQPESRPELLVLRPLGGADEEIAGILPALEEVRPARFELPDPERVGDFASAQLLRDALLLGFRDSAGPFRSFGSLNVDPRPYQLVPLLMALRQETVRLLIADDVGIGKTIEAGLIAKELLARGLATRLAVVCPPHLVEQWRGELWEKFQIEAQIVSASTAPRLERGVRPGESIFTHLDATVISLDWVKSDARRQAFLQHAPDLVIVDEAHACSDPTGGVSRHQRYRVLQGLAERQDRHLVLVTATPHSGNVEAFASLVGMLDPRLRALGSDESPDTEALRRVLAEHFVQRRRPDILDMVESTSFPERTVTELKFRLGEGPARQLFDDVLEFARSTVRAASEAGAREQRVTWWSAIALLRAMSSSPAAAAATLRNRAASADAATADDADAIGRRLVLDEDDIDADAIDVTPGADPTDGETETGRALRAFADRADALRDEKDVKLQNLIRALKQLHRDGFNPIVFCRFIDTAEYVGEALREKLAKSVAVGIATGRLPGEEREAVVAELAAHDGRRVLVATDCLSEGINLQEAFDAVVHYDLAWNPTRHEQREGRIDRFGQPRDEVRVLTMFADDTPVDRLVLDVLLRKHEAIRRELGVSVTVPGSTSEVLDAVIGRLLLSDAETPEQVLSLFDPNDLYSPQALERELEFRRREERASRTRYAQRTISTEEVRRQLERARGAVGSRVDVERFVRSTIRRTGGAITERPGDAVVLELDGVPRAVRDLVADREGTPLVFDPTASAGGELVLRTHPLVADLARYVLDTALDARVDGIAARCGGIRTPSVTTATTLLLLRFRFQLRLRRGQQVVHRIAEDHGLVAYEGSSPERAVWLDEERAVELLHAEPGNLPHDTAVERVRRVVESMGHLEAHLRGTAERRAGRLEAEHEAVKAQARGGAAVSIEAEAPDVLAIFTLLPRGTA